MPTTLNTTDTPTATLSATVGILEFGAPPLVTVTSGVLEFGALELGGHGAAPRVTVTSGLMVTVAFLTAFLVSPLTFSQQNQS